MDPNPQQLEVINHKDGPCLVTAVPGSGKTASLTARVGKLLQDGVAPEAILAITFTNKAAKEMRARISKTVGEEKAQRMLVCTFHSLCARLLRKHWHEAGLRRNFTIFDDDDQERLLKACFCKVLGIDKKKDIDANSFHEVLGYIERSRNACLDDGDRKILQDAIQYQIVEEYYLNLAQSNAVDFTGLLTKTLELLEKNEQIQAYYQNRWKYVSVDEVQDTNVAQYKIVSILAAKHKNLLFIGDLDQSIYRFRNASPENILQFERDFGAKVLPLEKNYRSTPEILGPAQRLIEHNNFRKPTRLVTDNPQGAESRIMYAQTDEQMADAIANFVDYRIRRGTDPNQIAILYRIKSASRVLEHALRQLRIKYKVIGGRSFYERKEVKGCLSILRLMSNDDDRMAFENCVDYCCRGVGPKTLHKIFEDSHQSRISMMAAARQYGTLGNKQAAIIGNLVGLVEKARGQDPSGGLLAIAKQTSFWAEMAADSTSENDRCGNIMELARDVEKYLAGGPGRTLDGYLQEVSLLSNSDEEGEDAKVNLMTIHASKGLEFEVVIISHVIKGILPHQNALCVESIEQQKHEIEEERRLLYVGMTRAKKWLRLAHCGYRFKQPCEASGFLAETGLKYAE